MTDQPAETQGDTELVHGDGAQQPPPPEAEAGPGWLGRAFLAAVAPNLPDGVRRRGQEMASNRQVMRLDVTTGAAGAVVKGEAGARHRVRLRVEPLTDAQWEEAATALVTSAMYLTALLAGELPPAVLEAMTARGINVLPADPGDLTLTCRCGAGMPCVHAAAVVAALADRLEREPLLVFTLRGISPDRLLEAVRQKRAVELRGEAAAHVDPLIAARDLDDRPLEACVDEFWRFDAQAAAELQDGPAPRHVPHALLRRLGPSPLKGRFPLAGLLASAYDAISDAAVELRDRVEAEAEPPDDDS